MKKPLPWATESPSLFDTTIETTAPFASLAIAGVPFRGGVDCAPTKAATRQIGRQGFIIDALSPTGCPPPEGFPVLASRMNAGNPYLLHPYHRFSNQKSGLNAS